MKAARPPAFCASAMMCRARVVFPLDSGPKISTTRPLGTPPTPRARSRARAPVGIEATLGRSSSPMRMIEPFPNCRSIWIQTEIRTSRALPSHPLQRLGQRLAAESLCLILLLLRKLADGEVRLLLAGTWSAEGYTKDLHLCSTGAKAL